VVTKGEQAQACLTSIVIADEPSKGLCTNTVQGPFAFLGLSSAVASSSCSSAKPSMPTTPPELLQKLTSDYKGPTLADNAPFPASQWDQAAAERTQKENTSFLDAVKGSARQGHLLPNIIASVVGHQFVPDKGFNPFEDKAWAQLTDGVPAEDQHYLAGATSLAHGLYLRDRLRLKQSDGMAASKLGTLGNLAVGFTDPVAWGLAGGAGLIGKGALSMAGGGRAVGALIGATEGTAVGYGLESSRQKVAMEDSPEAARVTALLGLAMGGGFGALAAHSQMNIKNAALDDLNKVPGMEAPAPEVAPNEAVPPAGVAPEDHAAAQMAAITDGGFAAVREPKPVVR